jgi:hypothetical protein
VLFSTGQEHPMNGEKVKKDLIASLSPSAREREDLSLRSGSLGFMVSRFLSLASLDFAWSLPIW